jgi:ParB family chromosome partitioning protein
VSVTKNNRRLGRGLAALLGTEEGGFEPSSLERAELMTLSVDQIDANPYQPRREFDRDEIASLAESLRQHGMLQPVIVRPVDDRYQLVAGERRLRAAIEAHLHEVPARVLELDDRKVCELAMVENLQREDLSPLDKAAAFKGYLDRYGCTQEDLAGRLGLDRSTISNLIRLLDLPDEIQQALRDKKITQGHARALLGFDDIEQQVAACRQVMADHLSVRQTEALVSTGEPTPTRTRIRKDSGHGQPGEKSPHFVELEGRLRERFGTPVLIRSRGKERGQIVIEYSNQEEFDRIAGLIRG